MGTLKICSKSLTQLSLMTAVTLMAFPAHADSIDEIFKDIKQCSPELISQGAATAVAAGNVEAEKSKRLPTFALSASGKKFAKDTTSADDTSVNLTGRFTLVSFGKFDANEDLAKQKFQTASYEELSKTQSVLADLLTKKNRYERLTKDISSIQAIVEEQQAILDRVKRRAALSLSSDSDENAVFSKVWQNKNRIRESLLEQEILKSEIRDIACTDRLATADLESLPKSFTEANKLSAEFENTSLKLLISKLDSKQKELKANDVGLRPDLDVVGTVPVDDKADENSSLGLEFNVSYGNMGRVEAAQSKYLELEVNALQRELEVTASRRVEELVRIQQQIISLREEIIPNQMVSVEATRAKLGSKERLFKAGRVSLFELLTAYDEVQTAELALNQHNASLADAEIRRAEQLDFIYR